MNASVHGCFDLGSGGDLWNKSKLSNRFECDPIYPIRRGYQNRMQGDVGVWKKNVSQMNRIFLIK